MWRWHGGRSSGPPTEKNTKKKKKKKKKRLVVHLGLRKVASTSLQVWLQENAPALRKEHNVLVLARSERFGPWREAVYDCMNDDGHSNVNSSRRAEGRLLRAVDREARKLRRWMLQQPEATILVSDENLFGARLYKEDARTTTTTLYDWACKILPRIDAIWDESAFDLTFVIYLRQRNATDSAWLHSCYNQEVKNNRLELSYNEWAAKLPPTLQDDKSWNDQFRLLQAQVTSPLRVVILGEEPQLGATLLQEVGVDVDGSTGLSEPPQQRLNESLPGAALEFMRAVNRSKDI